ncbi:MAG: hypothetical protein RL154_110 [Pseudomonadota bacterium]|jgi:DedD protein
MLTPEEQTNKNEINELLLGENEPASKGKKFFLIAAGVLLVFFIALGAMKLLSSGSTEEKQPVSIAQAKDKTVASAPQPDANISVESNASTDEKLNEIVQKLQQEAAAQSKPPEIVAPIHTEQPKTVEHKADPKTAPAPKVQEAPTVAQSPTPSQVKAVAVPIQAKPKPQPQAKEEQHTASPKAAMAEAAKKQPQPAAKPQPKPIAVAPTATASTEGVYYIQVGAFSVGSDASSTQSKAQTLGFKSIVKQVQVGEKTLQKVQVGPFNSKQEASEALNKAKEINSGAFVVKSSN